MLPLALTWGPWSKPYYVPTFFAPGTIVVIYDITFKTRDDQFMMFSLGSLLLEDLSEFIVPGNHWLKVAD